jgi:hypothetical protein
MNNLVESLIPVLVPVILALLKHFLPRLPKLWLPILAPVLGAAIEALASGEFGAGTSLGAALGAAGVGLREILDQLRKSSRSPAAGAAPKAMLVLTLVVVPATGCRSLDTTQYRSAASTEAPWTPP